MLVKCFILLNANVIHFGDMEIHRYIRFSRRFFFNIQMSGHIKILELSLSFYKILANPDKIAIKILSRTCKTSKILTKVSGANKSE